MAAFMARSQVLNLADNFKAVITTAAWRKQTKLGAGSGSGQSHQSRSRTVVCHTSQQPQGRSLRHQPLGLRFQAEGGCSCDRRSCVARDQSDQVVGLYNRMVLLRKLMDGEPVSRKHPP